MVAQDHHVARLQRGPDAAGGVRDEEHRRAEAAREDGGHDDLLPLAALVPVAAAAEDEHLPAALRAGEEEAAGVADDGRRAEAGDVGVGDLADDLEAGGGLVPAGAEQQRREGLRGAQLGRERGEGLVEDALVHGAAG